MATVQYQEGAPVYIRDGVAIDPWGNTYEGYDAEAVQEKADADREPVSTEQEPREDDRYDEMSAQELKDELQARRDAGREFDLTGVTRKAQLAEVLRRDDAAQAQDS